VSADIKVGEVVVIPKGTTVAQWGSVIVTKRDKKVKVFRLMPLDDWTARVVQGQWESGTIVVQFFVKSVLNSVRASDVQLANRGNQ
jgi:hypothetical protein